MDTRGEVNLSSIIKVVIGNCLSSWDCDITPVLFFPPINTDASLTDSCGHGGGVFHIDTQGCILVAAALVAIRVGSDLTDDAFRGNRADDSFRRK